MGKLEVNLRAHVIDSANESLRVFIEVRGKDEVCYLQVKVVLGVDVEIFRLQISVRKTFVLDGLKTIHQLLEVVASDRLRQTACL